MAIDAPIALGAHGDDPYSAGTGLAVIEVGALDVIDPEMEQPELPETPQPEIYRYPFSGFRADFVAAPDLLEMAKDLIAEYPQFATLAQVRLRFYWWRKIGKKGCEAYFGKVKKISGMLAHHLEEDGYVALSTFAAGAGSWSEEDVKKALYHMLEHIGTDDKGNMTILDHDFLGFSREVQEFGAWSVPLKLGRNAYREARQLGLLEEQDEDDDTGI